MSPLSKLAAAASFLALATSANAAPAPAAAPAAGLAVMLAPARMQAGETRRFEVTTDEVTTVTNPDRSQHEHDVQVIDLKVVSAAANRIVIEDTMVSVDDGPAASGPLTPAALVGKALIGLPIDYIADASGKPTGFVDWPGFRDRFFARVRALGAASPDAVKAIVEATSPLSDKAAIPVFLDEARVIADMQSWPPLPGMRLDDPPWSVGEGDTQANLTSFRAIGGASSAAACQMPLRRVTELDPSSPVAKTRGQAERLETMGVLSTDDGWILSLTETRNRAATGVKQSHVVAIRRLPSASVHTCGGH